ncbi:hypothetical protein KI387_039191, partial [Taxus chinensis]
MNPHALLIPSPGQGHINPMMQLAWKLVSDGFLVTFLNTDFNHHRIIQANTKNSSQNNSDMIRMISVPVELPAMEGTNSVENFLEALNRGMGASVIDKIVAEINEKGGGQKLTCIIADAWSCFGLQAVANIHGVSLAVFNTALVSLFAIRYFSPALVSLGILPSDGIPKEDKIVKYLPSMPPLYSRDLPWLYGGEYLFQKGIRMAEEIKQIKWMLFNSFYELEVPVVEELSKEVGVYPIGPLIPFDFLDGHSRKTTKVLPSFWTDEVECLEWLDKQHAQSVIYVSFGSFAALNEKQVEELAAGLEATRRPFLWVVRSDQMESSKTVFSPVFLERIRERGCIVSWAPQLRVLSHPAIVCFVTHCGWNSVQESITMGVPMLCWPYFGDQFLNRTYIVDVWKVGLALKTNKDGQIDKGVFTKTVETLLDGERSVKIREEANKLKTIARNTMKEGGSSSNNYNLFVNAMKKQP